MKRLRGVIALIAGIVTIANFMISKGLWPETWNSFLNDWIPWIAVTVNMAALIVLLYFWITLQSLKNEAIRYRAMIENLSKNLTLIQADPGKKRQATEAIEQSGSLNAKTRRDSL